MLWTCPASLNPNRFGRFRMPAVLEQWTDQKIAVPQRVKEEAEVIPIMGEVKTKKWVWGDDFRPFLFDHAESVELFIVSGSLDLLCY